MLFFLSDDNGVFLVFGQLFGSYFLVFLFCFSFLFCFGQLYFFLCFICVLGLEMVRFI